MSDQQATPTPEAEVWVRRKMLYMGVRRGDKNPRLHLWWDVDDLSNDGRTLHQQERESADPDKDREHLYATDKKRGNTNIVPIAQIGTVWSFEMCGSRIRGSTGEFEEKWANNDDVVKWVAESRAKEARIEKDRLAAAEKRKPRPDLAHLEPFRKAYMNLNSIEGAILLGEIIAYVSGRRG